MNQSFGGCACGAGKPACDCAGPPTKQCPPCFGDCEQGDKCPAEPPVFDFSPFELLGAAIVIVLTVIVCVVRQG